MRKHFTLKSAVLLALGATSVFGQTTTPPANQDCADVPSYADLKSALIAAQKQKNGGLGFQMWATVVNRDGIVCAVAFSGATRSDQWPGSRVISAQKANTANAFSVPGFALSSANLYAATQNGGSLFGLQLSNPVDPAVAYLGPTEKFGQVDDPLVSQSIGGINVFGGGLALYRQGIRKLVGGLGVSGDTSCTDHVIAWKVRDILNLDNVPSGVSGPAAADNMINDYYSERSVGQNLSPSAFGHPSCDEAATTVTKNLPASNPLGPNQP